MANHLYDALFGRHASNPRDFIIVPDGETLSYRQFLGIADRFAAALTALGAKPGDRIALQVAKSPAALAVYAACLQRGLALLPLNTAYTMAEVDHVVGDAEPRVFVCDPARQAELRGCAERHGATLVTLAADGSGSLGEIGGAAIAEPCPRDGGDLAAILYTSGTTGRSKGVMLSHANLLSNAATLVDLWQITTNDVLLHALPLYHTHGLFVAVNTVALAGAAMIFHESFATGAVIDALPDATMMMGVPTFYTRLLQTPALTRDLVTNVRVFISGSAPLLAETHVAFERRTGHRILERYGMTETSMNSSNPFDGERRPGTVGLPLPGVEIVVTGEDGAVLPPGAVGMIEVRGPNVFAGYWRLPDKTAADLRPNGFFITGDLGRFDADGYLSIVGRQKDLIISGGFNIYPKELELLIDAIDGVLESAVFGVPDADFGEAVIAAVVLESGAVVIADAILGELRPQLARFKHPRQLVIVDALPRNAMGKVQKNLLRDGWTV